MLENKGNQEMGSVERIDTSNVGDNNQHHDKADAANQRSVETIGDSNKDVQQWFSELSVEERCSALGFVDGPLLSVVLKHASLSIAQSTTASTCSDNRVADKQDISRSGTIDWNLQLPVNDFDKSWNDLGKPAETPFSLRNVTATTNDEGRESENKTPPETATSATPNHRKVATSEERIESSDAFRIRDDEKLSVPEAVEDEQLGVSSLGAQATPILEPEYVSELMNNICVIFQSAANLNPSVGGPGMDPFVTLQPSFLRTHDGAEIMSHLDEIMGKAVPEESFLSNPNSSSWKDLVSKAGGETSTVPLSILLLLRMKLSFLDSFQQRRFDAPQKEGSDGIDEVSASMYSLSPMSEVMSRLGSVSEEIFDSSALPEIVESDKEGAHYLLFPLRSLLQQLECSSQDFHDIMMSVDRVIALNIERFHQNSLNGSTKIVPSKTDMSSDKPNDQQDTGGSADHGQAAEAMQQTDQAAPQPSNGKRRKKKKKKRNGSGNAQGQGPAPCQQPQSGQPEGNEAGSPGINQVSLSESKDEEKAKKENHNENHDGVEESEVKDDRESVVRSPLRSEQPEEGDVVADGVLSENVDAFGAVEESFNDEDVVTNSESPKKGEKDESTGHTEESVGVARQDQADQDKNVDAAGADDQAPDDSGEWETVEVKPRGNRKKAGDRDRGNHGRLLSNNSNAHGSQNGNGSKKSKSNRNHNRKQKANARKMARELLSSVLDRVDEDVRKRRKGTKDSSRPLVNKWAVASPSIQVITGGSSANAAAMVVEQSGREMTMRDIVEGRQATNASTATGQSLPRTLAQPVRHRPEARGETKLGIEGKKTRDKLGSSKLTGAVFADQNTAPTIPETLSAVSAETTSRNATPQETGAAQGDSTVGGSGEGLKPPLAQGAKGVSPSPPLPTLLTENANSSSSSVASSLDTSHAGHHGNHISSTQGSEKDVGYHLLDVCDRLTRDINIFMKRREHALEIRRRERGSVLMALQGTLSNIWPGMCNVEMYGSCATQLDLPSSDLDVVVRGLDRRPESAGMSTSNIGNLNDSASGDTKELRQEVSNNSKRNPVEMQQNPQNQIAVQHQMHPQMMYGHLSLNAERIVRLAMELERQPWAVHVKAIPTASVPVIKILADPTRTSGNGEWLMQAPMSAEAPPVNGQSSVAEQTESSGAPKNSMPHFQGQQTPPWRGADVMNGLLKVDITFEGPEHGGIGSTKFSSRVVKEFCDETRLPPDSTPAVQVLMVVKELLAQRRLNEPFSGGLSSYALLLLVISVLRERAIIREELQKVERQRRIVAAGNVNPGIGAFSSGRSSEKATASGEQVDPTINPMTEAASAAPLVEKNRSAILKSGMPTCDKPNAGKRTSDNVRISNSSASKPDAKKDRLPGKPRLAATASAAKGSSNVSKPPASSWASIAKKKSSASVPARKLSQASATSSTAEKNATQQPAKAMRKANSFADAVANGSKGASKHSIAPAPPPAKPNSPEANENSGKKAPPKKVPSNAEGKPAPSPSSTNSGPGPSSHLEGQIPVAASTSMFPQGFHDVTEVLCSGETTAGKLLMHFLLFYGQHFDSQSTAIDYSGTHQRDATGNNGYSQSSPYMLRRTAGSYDPMTGMLTVDPIVVYDPLEGAETSNVARSCFAWSSIRWVFAQSYLTLLSTVEINQNHTSGKGTRRALVRSEGQNGTANEKKSELSHPWNGPYGHDKSGNMMIDPSSPLLELLLSF